MLDGTDKKYRLIIVPVLFLAATAFFANTININYNVKNSQLESNIEILEDEKANLRARYLSEIALDKLNSRAGQLDMKHVSSQECYKISAKIERLRNKKLKSLLKDTAVQEPVLLVSGY